MAFNASEIATIQAGGVSYSAWTRIEVERTWGSFYTTADFEAIEPSAIGQAITAAQIMPGTAVTITLGGQLAVTGQAYLRAVAYDKEAHDVKIGVYGTGNAAMNTTVTNAPGEYKNQTLQQIASAVLVPVGITPIVIGPNGAKLFALVHEQPGELRGAMLERLARMRGMQITDDQHGNVIFNQLSSTVGTAATFVEGGNIVRGRIIMQAPYGSAMIAVEGQDVGGSSTNMAGVLASQPSASAAGINIFQNPPKNRTVVAEHPGDTIDMQMRLGHQLTLEGLTILEATLTVSGWFAPSGQLWLNLVQGPTAATLNSQMLIPADVKQPPLLIKKVRSYQSSEEGTMTDVTIALRVTGGAMITNFQN
jgi:prophage tail gpP-like protein